MEKMSLQTFFILLVLAVFVGAGIGYILKELLPSLKDQSMTGQEYTNFLLRQAGKKAPRDFGDFNRYRSSFFIVFHKMQFAF